MRSYYQHAECIQNKQCNFSKYFPNPCVYLDVWKSSYICIFILVSSLTIKIDFCLLSLFRCFTEISHLSALKLFYYFQFCNSLLCQSIHFGEKGRRFIANNMLFLDRWINAFNSRVLQSAQFQMVTGNKITKGR